VTLPAQGVHGSEPVLVIKAKSGFGNRILAATTGIVLARLTGRRPAIDWREGMYVPVGVNLYPLLFDGAQAAVPEDYDGEQDVAPAIWAGRLRDQPIDLVLQHFPNSHKSPFVYRKLSLDLARPASSARVGVFWSYLPKLARLRGLMRRDARFAGRATGDIVREAIDAYFTPNERIRGEVDRLFAGREGPVIGVHIRYTDRKAPLAKIERALTKAKQQTPGAPIFLATDNAEVERRIRDRFDGVFVHAKELSTGGGPLHLDAVLADPVREAENALVDMWALSRCDLLIHSRHSTFSEAAALIGAIPRSRQVDVDKYNAPKVLKRWFQAFA
jgi:hypothetical protein